mgnify:CR=1 FL=1
MVGGGGLLSYDGNQFTNIQKTNTTPYNLIDETISSIIYDDEHGWYIGSNYAITNLTKEGEYKHLLRSDKVAKKYISDDPFVEKNKGLPNEKITALAFSEDGNIWVGLNHTLLKVSKKLDIINHYVPLGNINEKNETSFGKSSLKIVDIISLTKNGLLLATARMGVIKFDINTNTSDKLFVSTGGYITGIENLK